MSAPDQTAHTGRTEADTAIPQHVHDALTAVELRGLIIACNECSCPPEINCYCARNREWAERKLAELPARSPAPPFAMKRE